MPHKCFARWPLGRKLWGVSAAPRPSVLASTCTVLRSQWHPSRPRCNVSRRQCVCVCVCVHKRVCVSVCVCVSVFVCVAVEDVLHRTASGSRHHWHATPTAAKRAALRAVLQRRCATAALRLRLTTRGRVAAGGPQQSTNPARGAATFLQVWHLRPASTFYPKAQFYNVLAHVPDGSPVVMLLGEIDCREGLLVAVRKCKVRWACVERVPS